MNGIRTLLLAMSLLLPGVLCAQAPQRSGVVHTPDVDLHYEVLGASGVEIP